MEPSMVSLHGEDRKGLIVILTPPPPPPPTKAAVVTEKKTVDRELYLRLRDAPPAADGRTTGRGAP